MTLHATPEKGLFVLATLLMTLSVPSSLWATAWLVNEDGAQTVVVLRASTLLERRLPTTLQIQPGRFIPASAVHRACESLSLPADNVLLFFPDSRQCQPMIDRNAYAVREQLQALTGRWLLEDMGEQLAARPFVTITAPPRPRENSRSGCVCVGNTPPEGMVSCEAQTRNPQTFIAALEFLASDEDGDSLSGEFSYQRDSDPVQAGLPAALSSSCDAQLGTLSCIVEGIAPAHTGIFQLLLSVSDGSDAVQLDTLLEIIAPPAEQIFRDGFQRPQCP